MVAVLVFAVLILVPVAAEAECAWVLWKESFWISTKPGETTSRARWDTVSAFRVLDACEKKKTTKTKEQLGPVPSTEEIDRAGGAWGGRLICLPDTVDPRELKGK